jgi:hypothetical protein
MTRTVLIFCRCTRHEPIDSVAAPDPIVLRAAMGDELRAQTEARASGRGADTGSSIQPCP